MNTVQTAALYRPRKREGKTLGWQVERWNGKKWVSVPLTCCHYEHGAIDTARELNERQEK